VQRRVSWREKSEERATAVRGREKGSGKRGGWGYMVGDDRDEFVSFHAGKLSRSPRPMIYWATMW